MEKREFPFLVILALPVLIVATAFFLLPLVRLAMIAGSGMDGLSAYLAVVTTPRYLQSLISTTLLLAGVTRVTPAERSVVEIKLCR